MVGPTLEKAWGFFLASVLTPSLIPDLELLKSCVSEASEWTLEHANQG